MPATSATPIRTRPGRTSTCANGAPGTIRRPLLKRAALVDAARKRDWKQLPQMLAYIQTKDRDEVFATSLIRLMRMSSDERIAPVLLVVMKDPSPLVRSAAIEALSLRRSREAVQAMLDATGDEYRLVRTRAAAGLAGFPKEQLAGELKAKVEKANKEYLAFIMARPDQWTSHYNMGNYQLSLGKFKEAVASYNTALRLEPTATLAMVNASIAYSRMGETDKAEQSLQQALKNAPDNAAANFNMGLLKAEKNEPKQAETYLKKAIKADPQMAQAAYNLCIITSKDRIDEAVGLVPQGSGSEAAGAKVCLYPCLLSESEGRQGRSSQDITDNHKEVSGIHGCADASPEDFEREGELMEKEGSRAVISYQ